MEEDKISKQEDKKLELQNQFTFWFVIKGGGDAWKPRPVATFGTV